MGIREIRADFGARVDAAFYLEEPTVVTKNGAPRAVLVSYKFYEQAAKAREELATLRKQLTDRSE